MKVNENNIECDLVRILKTLILDSPELLELIDVRAEIKLKQREFPECLTRQQLAKIWKVSIPTIDRLTDEEIQRNGFIRKKIGVSVRFERIPTKVSCQSENSRARKQ